MALPGYRVIPQGWSEHHRPTSTASLNGACTVTRPGAPSSLDASTLQYAAAASLAVWSGPCRVQASARIAERSDYGELDLTTRRYLVVVEWQAQVEVDDIVTVTAAVVPQLAGQKLRVLDVMAGTEQWERDLECEDWESPGG